MSCKATGVIRLKGYMLNMMEPIRVEAKRSVQVKVSYYFHGFWGLSKSENGIGCFPTHQLGGDFDHGKFMRESIG